MRIADLKRAVEDVILKPEDNRLSDMSKRSTIAALDLCQLERVSETPSIGMGAEMQQHGSAATLTSFSCSGEMLASPSERSESTCSTSITTSSGPFTTQPPLSMSTSLDTMVLRQSLSSRPSLGTSTSRRSSRVLQHLSHSRRKRSNSVSSCMNKGLIGCPDTVSSDGVSSTTTGGASALSLPPTARHTPFRFADGDERQFVVTSASGASLPSSSLPYPFTLNETSPPDSKECNLAILSSVDEAASVDWSNTIPKEFTAESTHNPYDGPKTQPSLGYHQQGGETTIAGVVRRQQTEPSSSSSSAQLSTSFSFTAFRQPSNVCDLDEQMDCD